MTPPESNHNDSNLDDELNAWIATGHALLRRIRDKRKALQQADQELASVETRTLEALSELAAIKDAMS